jgi:YVTN family beta-propeller protein
MRRPTGLVPLVVACWPGVVLAAPLAWVTNFTSGDVSVIDTATSQVTATVSGVSLPVAVAAHPTGGRAYVGELVLGGGSNLAVVTTAGVGTRIAVDGWISGIAVSRSGKRAYAASSAATGSGVLVVLDAVADQILGTPLPLGSTPAGVAVTRDGETVYVAGDTVTVVDTSDTAISAVVSGTVDVGGPSSGVAINPKSPRLYVTKPYANEVAVVDTTTNQVTATVPVGTNPQGIAVTPNGQRVYVANSGTFCDCHSQAECDACPAATVSVIDTATNAVTASVTVGPNAFGLAVTPSGARVLVANRGGGHVLPAGHTLSVIETATNTVSATVGVGTGPVAFGEFIPTCTSCCP